ncbi:hypothetical protein [Micromonospora sp. NPDC048830]|uniref:hypothetical protein n=1 Tax=Micromonospora sp. NPDC048830 TaxID=3364257 RepID=UPI003714EDE1
MSRTGGSGGGQPLGEVRRGDVYAAGAVDGPEVGPGLRRRMTAVGALAPFGQLIRPPV